MERKHLPSNPKYSADKCGNTIGPSGRLLKQSPNRPDGYLTITIWESGRPRTRYVHRLVAEAFIGPCPEGMQVRHLNGDHRDNRAENLCYGTPAENAADKVRHGTAQVPMTHCARGHEMTPENVIHGRKATGKPRRQCRECYRIAARASRKRLREQRAGECF